MLHERASAREPTACRAFASILAIVSTYRDGGDTRRVVHSTGGIEVFHELPHRVAGLGARGPFAFGLGYVLAVVLMVPVLRSHWPRGARFGPVVGTLTVVAASNAGAAMAFLIGAAPLEGRYRAGSAETPRFEAIDGAISKNRGPSWSRSEAVARRAVQCPELPLRPDRYRALDMHPHERGRDAPRAQFCMSLSDIVPVPASKPPRARLGPNPAEWALLAVGVLATLRLSVLATSWARRTLKLTLKDNN